VSRDGQQTIVVKGRINAVEAVRWAVLNAIFPSPKLASDTFLR
jgi:hypothetical protein